MRKMAAEPTQTEEWIPTVCDMCYNSCSINVRVVNGRVVKIEGLPGAPPNFGVICAKGHAAIMNLYNPHRIAKPLARTNPEKGLKVDPGWKEISWDEALNAVVEKLKKVREDDPRKLVAATFDTYSFSILRAFLTAYGTPNFTAGPAGYFCGNGVHPVAYTVSGANDVHPDLRYSNYCILFGNQFGFVTNSNAMPLATEMADARLRGMKLVVIDPLLSNAAANADRWIPIKPGTDAALALGIMNILVNELHIFDDYFLRKYTNGPYLIGPDDYYVRDETGKPLVWDAAEGTTKPYNAEDLEEPALEGSYTVNGEECKTAFQRLKEHVAKYSPEKVQEITSVPSFMVRQVAKEFGEHAEIGKTIRIEGKELPHRPVVATWYRGAVAHRHAMHTGLAIALLNAIVGAVDVPGGLLNANSAGPFGFPKDGADGILTAGNKFSHMRLPHPYSKPKKPETLELIELFPLAVYARAMLWLGVLEPERFKIPYKPEILIHCRTNLVANTADPEVMAEALKKVPFTISFADHHNETTQFADIVFPDAHSLERLIPMPMNPYVHFRAVPLPGGDWSFNLQQPVVEPFGESRYWGEAMLEIGERMGMLGDIYAVLNSAGHFSKQYALSSSRKYSYEEICDRWLKSWFGEEHGLEYFRKHGYLKHAKRTVEELYPRPFNKGRIPVYFEHFKHAGQEVEKVTKEIGVPWDTSDYTPLLDWKPCSSHEEKNPEFDLWLVNHKLPYYTFTFSAENPWLNEMCDRDGKVYNVGINTETAKRKGIKTGDKIWIETPSGRKAQTLARVTEGIHPDVISVPGVFGRWITSNPEARGRGVHFNSLIEYTFKNMDMLSAALDACVKVKVYKG